MIIRLNGNAISSPIDGVDTLTVRYRMKDEEGNLSRSFSEELTFYGEGFEIIRDELINNAEGKFNTVKIELVEDCCGDPYVVFEGIIRGDTIDWCEGECFVKVSAIEETEQTLQYDCLKSTLIFDNQNGFQESVHPRVTYCVELRPALLQDLTLIFGMIFNLVFYLLYPLVFIMFIIIEIINGIISVINSIINAINALPGIDIDEIDEIDLDGDADTNTLEEYQNLIDRMNENIIGCGRQHPTPLLRNYIENVCQICGLTFESSILNDPDSDYYNLLYLNAQITKGTRDDDVTWLDDNRPIKTGQGLLNELKILFNGDYRVLNSILTFERKDFFYDGESWLNYETLKNYGLVDEKICYAWRDEDVSAYARLEYGPDPIDMVGNEAKKLYSDIIEWNQPYSSIQKGSKEVIFPFSPARFRGDGIDRDVLGDYEFFWPNLLEEMEDVLLLQNGVAFNPKLLIWDGESIANAKVKKFDVPGFVKPPEDNFNFPMLINEHNVASNTSYDKDTPLMSLYGRFHSIDHPKVLNDQGKEFEFSFYFKCNHLLEFKLEKTLEIPFNGDVAEGRIEWVEIDYKTRRITVFGKF